MGRRARRQKPRDGDLGLGAVPGAKPPAHDWAPTGRRFKDHVGMKYEVYVCKRCAMRGKRYGKGMMCFAGPCPPVEE